MTERDLTNMVRQDQPKHTHEKNRTFRQVLIRPGWRKAVSQRLNALDQDRSLF